MIDDHTTLRPESPLNKKDPVREQIERDASLQTEHLHPSDGIALEAGMKIQDPIAWNRALDAVINLYLDWITEGSQEPFSYRLEKLRISATTERTAKKE